MPESTVRKSTVHFRIVGSGTFVVSHEEGESPAQVLKDAGLSPADLYLHSEEFEWKIETTDPGPIDEEFYPPELGGGRMPKYPPTLVCECGRSMGPYYDCRCGRTIEQFERND